MPTPQGNFYQFFHGTELLERVVARQCQRDSQHVKRMPAHGWIDQKQASQSGCLVFWTAEGVKRILQSGYLGWQCAVAPGDVKVRVVALSGEAICVDKHQLLCPTSEVKELEMLSFAKLLEMSATTIPRVRAYLLMLSKSGTSPTKLLIENVAHAGYDLKVPSFDLRQGESFEALWADLKRQWHLGPQATLQKVATGYGYSLQKKEFYQTQQWLTGGIDGQALAELVSKPSEGGAQTFSVTSPEWLHLEDATSRLPDFIASKVKAAAGQSTASPN